MNKGDKYIQKYFRRNFITIEWENKNKVCFKDTFYQKNFVCSKEYFYRSFEIYDENRKEYPKYTGLNEYKRYLTKNEICSIM